MRCIVPVSHPLELNLEPPALSLTSSTAAAPLVLIVDDDVDSCDMYSLCMKAAGLRVAQEHDGMAGFDRARRSQPDLLVTDIVMPGLDGFELTRRLRETSRMQGLPVIAVTARPITEVDITRLQSGGPTSILMKPCEPIRLLVEIWQLLHDSQALRQRAMALVERAAMTRARACEAYGKSVVQRERWLTLVASRRLQELDRIRAEFLEMPDLSLTAFEAARLFAIDEQECTALLDSLVAERFLTRTDGRYRRA